MKKGILWALGIMVGITVLGMMIGGEPEAGTPAAIEEVPSKTASMTKPQRFAYCSERIVHYKKMGVWSPNSLSPEVSYSAWNELTDAEQDEIFWLGACVGTQGGKGDYITTVTGPDGAPRLGTRRITVE